MVVAHILCVCKIGIINLAVIEQLLTTMLSPLSHLGASLVVEHTAFAATANAAAKAHFVASGLCFVVISSVFEVSGLNSSTDKLFN